MVDEERKEKLEERLKAIQDIKSDYYVGTKEAYDVLKAIEKVYNNPKEVSERINKKLKEKFPELSYPATPARVVGLEYLLSSTSMGATYEVCGDNIDYYNPMAGEYLGKHSDAFGLFNTNESIHQENDSFLGKPEIIAKALYLFFERANEEKIVSDKNFAGAVIETLSEEYGKIEPSLDEKENTNPGCDIYVAELVKSLFVSDWNAELSREYFKKREKNYLWGCKDDLSTKIMLKRMLKDQVEHRLEYRRMVLCHWLTHFEIKDFEGAIDLADSSVKKYSQSLERIKRLEGPEAILDDFGDTLKAAKFIRHSLGQEENFVRRYLEH